jgi:hypothetical protein
VRSSASHRTDASRTHSLTRTTWQCSTGMAAARRQVCAVVCVCALSPPPRSAVAAEELHELLATHLDVRDARAWRACVSLLFVARAQEAEFDGQPGAALRRAFESCQVRCGVCVEALGVYAVHDTIVCLLYVLSHARHATSERSSRPSRRYRAARRPWWRLCRCVRVRAMRTHVVVHVSVCIFTLRVTGRSWMGRQRR